MEKLQNIYKDIFEGLLDIDQDTSVNEFDEKIPEFIAINAEGSQWKYDSKKYKLTINGKKQFTFFLKDFPFKAYGIKILELPDAQEIEFQEPDMEDGYTIEAPNASIVIRVNGAKCIYKDINITCKNLQFYQPFNSKTRICTLRNMQVNCKGQLKENFVRFTAIPTLSMDTQSHFYTQTLVFDALKGSINTKLMNSLPLIDFFDPIGLKWASKVKFYDGPDWVDTIEKSIWDLIDFKAKCFPDTSKILIDKFNTEQYHEKVRGVVAYNLSKKGTVFSNKIEPGKLELKDNWNLVVVQGIQEIQP